MNLDKEIKRNNELHKDKIIPPVEVYYKYFFVKFVWLYAYEHKDDIQYDEDGFVILNNDMKNVINKFEDNQKKSFMEDDVLGITQILNEYFNTNLSDDDINSFVENMRDEIYDASGASKFISEITELEDKHPLITKIYLKLKLLQITISLAIKKWFKRK